MLRIFPFAGLVHEEHLILAFSDDCRLLLAQSPPRPHTINYQTKVTPKSQFMVGQVSRREGSLNERDWQSDAATVR